MLGYFNTYIAKYYNTPKKKSYTFLGLSLGLVITFVVFAIRPTFSTVVELRQKLREGQEANKKLDEKIASLSLAQEVYGKIKNDLPLLAAAVPKEKQLVDFLNKVNLLAAENELLVETLEYKKTTGTLVVGGESLAQEKEGRVEPLEFTVLGKGDYEKTKSFIGRLEKTQRLVNIISVEITRQEGEEELVFTMVGRVYYEMQNAK